MKHPPPRDRSAVDQAPVAALIASFAFSLYADAESASRSSANGWVSAFKMRSSTIFAETLASSVMLEAGVLTRDVQGRDRVQTILTAASGLYEALDFTRCAEDGDRTYMEWEARLVGGERVAGISTLTADAAGKFSTIAIHHRPLPSALRFSAELGRALAGKIEPELFQSAS